MWLRWGKPSSSSGHDLVMLTVFSSALQERLKRDILPLAEAWSGVRLQHTSTYGIRWAVIGGHLLSSPLIGPQALHQRVVAGGAHRQVGVGRRVERSSLHCWCPGSRRTWSPPSSTSARPSPGTGSCTSLTTRGQPTPSPCRSVCAGISGYVVSQNWLVLNSTLLVMSVRLRTVHCKQAGRYK